MENDLKVWRAREDLTQAELATQVDVSRQTINAIETGKYDPSLELAFKLADRFDCAIEDIFTPEREDDEA
jgi:putative transcriptional regulator